jgi:hypothetical protein
MNNASTLLKEHWPNLVLVLLTIILWWGLFHCLPEKESDYNHYLGTIGLIGAVATFFGLGITYIQVLRMAGNTKTYEATFNMTISRLKNNDTISVISRAIQQISLIKKFIDMEKIGNTRDNFNNLMIDLSILSKNKKLGSDSGKIDKFIEFCSNMETNIITNNLSSEPELLRGDLNTLSQIQIYLIGLSESFKTPEKNE